MKAKRFLAILAALPLVFAACKKDHTPTPDKEATVQVTVLSHTGKPVAGAEVRIYNESRSEALEKDAFTTPMTRIHTNRDGVAIYTMRVDPWFTEKKQRFVTFAVLQGTADNYHLWSAGCTVQIGQKVQVQIQLTEAVETPDDSDNPGEPALKSLEVSRLPDKRSYTLGETLDLTGLEVTGHYDDGNERIVEVTPEQIRDFTTGKPAKELSLTVEIAGCRTSFTVEVLPIRLKDGVLTEVAAGYDELVLPAQVRGIAGEAFAASRITKLTLNEGLQTIGEMAFCGASIRELVLPGSLEELGEYAFYHCESLARVDMSRTKLTVLPRNLFAYAGIEQVVWPAGLTEIGTQCFLGTPHLKQVELPETVRQIGFEAFRESAVERLSWPEAIREVSGRAFYLCKALTEVTVHGTAGETADGAIRGTCFVGCTALERLAIPRNIRTLEQGLLTGNKLVTSITIPAGVREIAFGAFDNTGIREVRVEAATPPTAGLIREQWYGFPKGVEKITVPAGTAEAYKQAAGWSRFADRIE